MAPDSVSSLVVLPWIGWLIWCLRRFSTVKYFRSRCICMRFVRRFYGAVYISCSSLNFDPWDPGTLCLAAPQQRRPATPGIQPLVGTLS